MNNTPYLPIGAFNNTNTLYLGGFSKLWFVPREWLDGFPELNPLTQVLSSEPTLLVGKSWLSASQVANELMGYEETSNLTTAGNFYKRKVSFSENGLSATNHLNIGNLLGYEFCVVGLVRSGNFFMVIGNDKAGLKMEVTESTGNGPLGMPNTKIVLSDESVDRAMVLPSFNH